MFLFFKHSFLVESNRQISYKRNFTSEVDLESESLQGETMILL